MFSLSACSIAKNKSSEVNSNNSYESQNQTNDSVDILEPFELNSISYEIKLDELRNIVDYNNYYNLFITSDGSLYKIGNFSDGTNLKRIAEEIKFVKFSRGTIISDKNDVYIYDEEKNSVSLYSGVGYVRGTLIPSDDYLNSAHAVMPDMNFPVTSYIKDKEVFLYKGERVATETSIYKFANEEELEYFIDGTIKTNQGYYYFKETVNNSKYDDVPTTYTYSLENIVVLNDDIIFVKHYEEGSALICTVDKNGCLKIYSRVFAENQNLR